MNAQVAAPGQLTTWISAKSMTTIDAREVTTDVPPQPARLGRYRVLRTLGVGGMGVVYEARSDGNDDEIALKTLLRLSPTGLFGFKQEFRRTASLSHPNLVSLYELSQDDGVWYFSMELVHGKQLLHYVWNGTEFPGPKIAAARLRHALPQLLDALSFLHDHDVLHLDIKPSNVLVTKEGEVKLLDFGLSKVDSGVDSGSGAVFAGTPGYMAPEQIWGTHTKACDFYAVGATLFEAMTGQLPYVGPVRSTLLAKSKHPAPPVLDVEPDVPIELAEVIDALLDLEPSSRATLDSVREHLGLGASVTPRFARSSMKRAPELFGRSTELEQLATLFDESTRRTVICRLVGDSGVGKSSLLNEAMRRWQTHGALVLTSRCYQWEAIPFKAADALVDQLYEYASSRTNELDLPIDLALATRMFPVLEGLSFDRHPQRPPDLNTERVRASRALGTLVAQIAKTRQVVLCVDDSHWGDAESADLIGHLVDVVSRGLFVVLGMRPDGEQAHVFPERMTTLAEGCDRVEMKLGSLPQDAALSLARAMSGSEAWSEEQLRSITEDADGIPIFIEQVARFGSRLGSRPPTMAEVIDSHYQKLTDDERALLDMVVIARRPTRLRQILSAMGGGVGVHKVLDALQSISFVRSEGPGEAAFVEAYHDRVRQVALAQLSPERTKQLHLALAERLQADAESPGRVAEHWYHGGEFEKAAECAVLAAEMSYEALAFEQAADLYDRAFTWDPALPKRRPELLQQQAWALYRAGHCRRAGEAFAGAADRASTGARLELRGHAVEALLVAGQVDRGDQVLRTLLSEMSIRPVMRAPWSLLQLVMLIVLVRFRTRKDPEPKEIDRAALQKADIMWDAGKALTNLLPIDGIVLLLRSLLFALRSGDQRTIARGLCIVASGYVPFFERRSAHLLAVAERIAETREDPYLKGMLGVTRSTVGHMSGRWSYILEQARAAQAHLDVATVATNWESSLLKLNVAVALEHLGDFKRLGDYGNEHATAAKRRGDLAAYVAAINDYGLAQAAANDLTGLSKTIEDNHEVLRSWTAGYGVWHCTLWRLELLRALRQGDDEKARELFDEQWPQIVDALLLETRALRTLALECKAAVVLSRAAMQARGKRRWLKMARQLIRAIEPTQRTDARPLATMIRAALAHVLGDHRAAEERLEWAATLFDDVQMRERACVARWQLAKLRGDDAERAHQERIATSLGVANLETWSKLRAPGFDAA